MWATPSWGLSYDTATPDYTLGATLGNYDLASPPGDITVTFGALTYRSQDNPAFIDEIKINYGATLHQFNFRTVVSDPNFDNSTYGNFSLLFKDCTVGVGCSGAIPDALSSDMLPTSFNLGDWDSARGAVLIPGNDGGGTLSLTITSIVPEPGTALLLGIGLAGLASRQRRR